MALIQAVSHERKIKEGACGLQDTEHSALDLLLVNHV
jgi:hypothetical protein